MKKLLSLLVLMGISACQTDPKSFYDFYGNPIVLGPAGQELHNLNITASISTENRIYGQASERILFSTEDFFQTIQTGPVSGYKYSAIEGKVILEYRNDGNNTQVYQSVDAGTSYNLKYTITGSANVIRAINENTIWVLRQELSSKMGVIKVDLQAGTQRYIQTLDGRMSGDIVMNSAKGYIMLKEAWPADNSHVIYTTTDQGESWNQAGSFDLAYRPGSTNLRYEVNTLSVVGNLLYAQDRSKVSTYAGEYMYISRNGGGTWEFFSDNGLKFFHFTSERVGYALKVTSRLQNNDPGIGSKGLVYKTTDAGKTWTEASEKEIYADRIFFLNEDIGLAMSRSVLQMTTDGGKNWELLVYPLED